MIEPIFVVGCFRSGTTLIDKVLRRHPDLSGLGFETCAFTHLAQQRRLPTYNADRWGPFLRRLPGTSSWDDVADPLLIFERVMESVVADEGALGWVEKTPAHLFHVSTILHRYPRARIVLALRDGRDVATSIMWTPYILPQVRRRSARLLSAVVLWQWFAQEAVRLLATPAADRIHVVCYEELVTFPTRVLMRLARELGLAGDGWADAASRVSSNSTFGSWTGLSTRSVGRWRDRSLLNGKEVDRLERALAPTLEAMGYVSSERAAALLELSPMLRGSLALHVVDRALRHAAARGRHRPGPLPLVWDAVVGKRVAGKGAPQLPSRLTLSAASSGE